MITEEYQQVYGFESLSSYGTFGIKILVSGSKLPDLKQDEIQSALYKSGKMIQSEIEAARISADPKSQERSALERANILSLFDGLIYVEEIPNGYCSEYCCRHLPWFIVTTTVGRIKIGWRKRVLSIDWSDTKGTKTSEELFPSEDTTKDEKLIHAWSYEKAKEYINAIINQTKS